MATGPHRDVGQAQIQMSGGNGAEWLYWVHLDNPMEAAPPGTHSATNV